MSPTTDASTSLRFRERLWPSTSWWIVAAFLSAMTSLMVYPVWATGAFIVPIVVFGLVALWLRSISAVIIVTDEELIAGSAHIPLRFISGAEAKDDEQSFVERGHGLDVRAFLLIRPWVRTVVKATIDDPADPTPYWLISTRRADELAAALTRG